MSTIYIIYATSSAICRLISHISFYIFMVSPIKLVDQTTWARSNAVGFIAKGPKHFPARDYQFDSIPQNNFRTFSSATETTITRLTDPLLLSGTKRLWIRWPFSLRKCIFAGTFLCIFHSCFYKDEGTWKIQFLKRGTKTRLPNWWLQSFRVLI